MSQANDDFDDCNAHRPLPRLPRRARVRPGELEVATDIANAIHDEWRVVITMGPFRGYNIHYNIEPESRIVHLTSTPCAPAAGYNRQQVIADIQKGIQQAQDL